MVADFDSTLGATYVGVTTTACLYGISTLHGYTYWNRPNQDSLIAKIFVSVQITSKQRLCINEQLETSQQISLLWLVDTAKLVCATHVGYRLLITEYENDPEALFHSTCLVVLTTKKTQFLLTALTIFGAQVLRTYQSVLGLAPCDTVDGDRRSICLRLSSIRKMQGGFAFIQLGFGIAMSCLAWVYWDIREMDKHRWISSAWTGSTSLCSIIITYNLSALLASTDMRIHDSKYCGLDERVSSLLDSYWAAKQTILAVLNARSRETPDLPIFEEYEFGAAGYKAELNNGMSKVNIEGSLRIGNPSIKIPPRILRREPAITVLVQQETHIIGISETNSDDRNSTLRHHEDSDDTESVDYRADLAKSQTPTI
ncbi:hypothetical protein RHS04_08056 [Rhizoctonia solani]|uniref:Uncharacterized protein n=1 Tax=Rhizoctonia solani TaxID=456999 RepID=A0A8H7H4I2_9AGAM|nr:hypothetical protein RHS04_08056 [Rhizoctonia solani]